MYHLYEAGCSGWQRHMVIVSPHLEKQFFRTAGCEREWQPFIMSFVLMHCVSLSRAVEVLMFDLDNCARGV